MKYGESTFDIIYLLFAIISGIVILMGRRDTVGKLMGSSALILGCGDAFHLVPRVLNYFIESDFTAWLGFGKLVTSITMTFFYMLIFFLHTKLFTWEEGKNLFLTGKSLAHRRGLRSLGLFQKYSIHCNWNSDCDYLLQDTKGKSAFQKNVVVCQSVLSFLHPCSSFCISSSSAWNAHAA